MANTFDGANLEFPNLGIHYLLAEVIKFRKQLTVRDEFSSQSGWDNSMNHYLVKGLEQLADTLENITYNPDDLSQEELEAQAADTTRQLADDYNERALSQDNVLMPPSKNRQVVWDLSGSNADIPQMTPANCPNDHARGFITHLDDVFVQLTRLDSRWQANMITKYESTMIRAYLNNLYTITQRKGGEDNRTDIPTGTLPTQDANTYTG
ncbi:MAG: hypothetical protein ACYSUK_00255 [Planctomycetota bacterium]|jgi:hypothetical protein